MSTKHLFNTSEGLVAKSLQGFTASNPHLRLDLPNRVVFAAGYEPTKVAVISGGGAGHEPAHLGYTGKGMLSACVSGDVFASPR
jgi:dihydroxyacetone kinase